MSGYNPSAIESKWKQYWKDHPINPSDPHKKKYYCLDMFPYPSGSGMHVGHWRGYVLSDAISRLKLMQGYEVLHPMGFDSFGLPAENYAIAHQMHPKLAVEENIKVFKRQLNEISAMYDWTKEIITSEPDYYKWTQWIFIKMYEQGLAYEKEMPLNWCESCKTVLANEEAAGGVCERCGAAVTKKNLRQWMLKITKYADRLLEDLTTLNWPEKVKKMQSDWIGKSYGAKIQFPIKDTKETLAVFTTRPDTLFGVTCLIVAPEHPLLDLLTKKDRKSDVKSYVEQAVAKSNVKRMAAKEKTGVFTGSYVIHPISKEEIPVFIADYILIDYGTGAVMCVPAHDERDFAFAKTFDLPIRPVIKAEGSLANCEMTKVFTQEGILINSDQYSGLSSCEAIEQIANDLEKKGMGEKTVQFKLRDWVFSRQRYWGEPIPIIHCPICKTVPVPEKDLPVLLPDIASYEPTETGESPLAAIDSFVHCSCPICGGKAKRETNTMPQWAASSWYFLRYPDAHNHEELASKKMLSTWLPVDMYVGGVEHAVLHLLYARFYTKFLYDIGVVDFTEPFTKLFNQGMITKDGAKMSKSKGNVVSPDELVEHYGTDSLRLYELFLGPPEQDAEWDDSGIDGVYRFLKRLFRLVTETPMQKEAKREEKIISNQMIDEISKRTEQLSFNTVVSGLMEYTNKLSEYAKKNQGLSKESITNLILLLAPFAPFMAEELWERTGHENSVFLAPYPKADPVYLEDDHVTIAIQVNGKLRDSIQISKNNSKEEVLQKAKHSLQARLLGKEIIKEIYVPGKIINFVVK